MQLLRAYGSVLLFTGSVHNVPLLTTCCFLQACYRNTRQSGNPLWGWRWRKQGYHIQRAAEVSRTQSSSVSLVYVERLMTFPVLFLSFTIMICSSVVLSCLPLSHQTAFSFLVVLCLHLFSRPRESSILMRSLYGIVFFLSLCVFLHAFPYGLRVLVRVPFTCSLIAFFFLRLYSFWYWWHFLCS